MGNPLGAALPWYTTVDEPTLPGAKRPQVIGTGAILNFEVIDEKGALWPSEKREVRWFTKQFKTNGQDGGRWEDEKLLGQGKQLPKALPGPGIYRVFAKVSTPLDQNISPSETVFDYVRIQDEIFEGKAYGPGRVGAPDAIGVVSRPYQGLLVQKAEPWAKRFATEYSQAVPNPPWKVGDDKFNKFVGDRCGEAGLKINLVTDNGFPFYPMANEWAGNFLHFPANNEFWPRLEIGQSVEPGFVVAIPRAATSGHVGIVDYDGMVMAAGGSNVHKNLGFYNLDVPLGRAEPSRHRQYREAIR